VDLGKVHSGVNELLALTVKSYYIDQTPPFDQVKNQAGFISWDTEEISHYHNSEGLGYGNMNLVVNFELTIIVYAQKTVTRSSILKEIYDILQPMDETTGRRRHLIGRQLTKAYVRNVVHVSNTEFGIEKTAQSNAEMSATVMTFNCSFSMEE